MSVICFATNEPAVRFYRDFGFAEAARRPAPAHPAFDHAGGEMLLLTRSARQTAAERALADVPVATDSIGGANGAGELRPSATVVPLPPRRGWRESVSYAP